MRVFVHHGQRRRAFKHAGNRVGHPVLERGDVVASDQAQRVRVDAFRLCHQADFLAESGFRGHVARGCGFRQLLGDRPLVRADFGVCDLAGILLGGEHVGSLEHGGEKRRLVGVHVGELLAGSGGQFHRGLRRGGGADVLAIEENADAIGIHAECRQHTKHAGGFCGGVLRCSGFLGGGLGFRWHGLNGSNRRGGTLLGCRAEHLLYRGRLDAFAPEPFCQGDAVHMPEPAGREKHRDPERGRVGERRKECLRSTVDFWQRDTGRLRGIGQGERHRVLHGLLELLLACFQRECRSAQSNPLGQRFARRGDELGLQPADSGNAFRHAESELLHRGIDRPGSDSQRFSDDACPLVRLIIGEPLLTERLFQRGTHDGPRFVGHLSADAIPADRTREGGSESRR